MRWKTVLTVPALLLAATATIATAQQDSVPVTVTLEPRQARHPVDAVKLYRPDGTQLGNTVSEPTGNQRLQTYVGDLAPVGDPPRYELKATLMIGGSEHDYEFSFGPEDDCTESSEKGLTRIACSAVKHGAGLVCTGIYAGMGELGTPGKVCHSHACVYCERVKVCGSNPECP